MRKCLSRDDDRFMVMIIDKQMETMLQKSTSLAYKAISVAKKSFNSTHNTIARKSLFMYMTPDTCILK
jgi:hypothetical protein